MADPQLTEMVSGVQDVPEIYRPSPFWDQLAAAGAAWLAQPATSIFHRRHPVQRMFFDALYEAV